MINTNDQFARYKAYSNYVIALARLIKQLYPDQVALAKELAQLRGMSKIKGGNVLCFSELEQSLRMAWNTELLLHQSIQYPALLPYSIPWSMVQSYYAVYAIIRAYFNAFGRQVEETHQTTLKTIGSDLTSYRQRFPEPWCCVLESFTDKSQPILGNMTESITITLNNPLMSPYTTEPWQYFGFFLKSTWTRKVDRAIKKWKKQNNKNRILRTQRLQVVEKIGHTTIFDALYRMRSRSNYHDVDSFIFTDIDLENFVELQKAFVDVVSSTLMVFEFIIVKAIGKEKYAQIVMEFSSTQNGRPSVSTVQKRWKLMKDYL